MEVHVRRDREVFPGVLQVVEFPVSPMPNDCIVELVPSMPMEMVSPPSVGNISTQVNFVPKPVVFPRMLWKSLLGYPVEFTLLRSKGIYAKF